MDCVDAKQTFNIETFDLIGFKGTELVSQLVIYLQRRAITEKHVHVTELPEISHVGLAIHGRDIYEYSKTILKDLDGKIDRNEVYVFESTASGTMFDRVADILDQYHFGVQLRPLSKLLEGYPGTIYWSSKLFNVKKLHFRKLAYCIKSLNYKPYETSFQILFANVCQCVTGGETPDAYFCSELVAKCLQMVDILPKSVNTERVAPLDFYIDPKNPTRTLDMDGEVPILYNHPILLRNQF